MVGVKKSPYLSDNVSYSKLDQMMKQQDSQILSLEDRKGDPTPYFGHLELSVISEHFISGVKPGQDQLNNRSVSQQ